MRIHGTPTEQLNWLGIAITLIVIVALAAFIDLGSIKETIVNAGPLAPILLILLKASTVVVAPLSGGPIYPVVGLVFGFWPGMLYVALGDLLGITIAFWLSRIFGYPVVRRFIKSDEQSMLARIRRHIGTTKGIFQMSITCFALPELVAYASGLSKLPYWKLIAIFYPILVVVSSMGVLFGSLIDPESEHSLLITVGAGLGAGAIILVGGWLFLRGVRKEA